MHYLLMHFLKGLEAGMVHSHKIQTPASFLLPVIILLSVVMAMITSRQHIAENPLDPEFARYERRVSHHQMERESIEEIEKGEGKVAENAETS